MEISPERREGIKTSLSLFMSEEETERFIALGDSLAMVKKEQPPWQALVSIGVYIAELYLWGETEAEKAILKSVTDYSLEPLEALLESLTPESGKDAAIKDERAQLLFQTRFAFGFLLMAKGEKERAREILHEMAATKLSVRGNEIRSGPGIVKWTTDMAMGKLQTAIYLMVEYGPQEEYEELLYLMTEAIACNSSSSVLIFLAPKFLDTWAAKCEKEDDPPEYDFPSVNWLHLFVAAADILSICQESDSSGAPPNECKKESPQFLAWNFGQMVGRFAYSDSRWRDNPFEKVSNPKLLAGYAYEYEGEQFNGMWQVLLVLASLLSEYDLKRDWCKLREHYVEMWKGAYTYRGTSLSEIGPESDLYWAMRLGFADKILEYTKQAVLPIQTQIEPLDALRNLESIKESASVIALRQMRQQQALDKILERMPPNKREICQNFERLLGSVLRELPARVVNALVKAEKCYRTDVNDDDSKVGFNKAVEACFDYYMVQPLVNFMQARGDKQMAICFPPPRGVERKSSSSLRKLFLWEWGDALEAFSALSHKGLTGLGTDDFREFMKAHLGGSRFPDFRLLSESLRKISAYKGSSSHYKDADARYESERNELEQMRNLVLGINGPSVIVQIFQLLSAKSSSWCELSEKE